MKTTSDAFDIVAHSDFNRSSEIPDEGQDQWGNMDPARLIHLLENIDGLKQEVQERMRRVEAVNKAKSLLQEDAIRTEALNRKLAELGKAFGEVRHETAITDPRAREAELIRMPARETVTEIPLRHAEPPAPLPEKSESLHVEKRDDHAFAAHLYRAPAAPAAPAVFEHTKFPHEVAVRQFELEEFSASDDILDAELIVEPVPVTATEVMPEMAVEPATVTSPELHELDLQPIQPPAEPAPPAVISHAELHVMPVSLPQAAVHEAESSQPVQDVPAQPRQAYREVAQRFSEAAILKDEAKTQPVVADEPSAEVNATLNGTMIQLEEAKQAWAQANEAFEAARQLMEQSTAILNLSRSKEEMSSTDLKSAQQDLTTAYQFAAVAAQRQHDAAEVFRKSRRWAIAAFAASWIVIAWVSWLQLRAAVPVWGPVASTVVIVALAVLLNTKGNKRD